ncbi:A-kinase anchor protein 14-like [Bactrocera dorsalis]|uniref:A-kinase anchor protein 14-like n=1 Tax=Bactrocera dorsalis TaxID=27457 RepID=A0A6I9VCH3_BACDO|nr:A-kinase anchor protein 14-like [Bactrocera dorsalis]
MFKYITFVALFAIATAAPGFIAQPVVAKVGAVVHTVPSATSHQSIIQVHNNAHIVTPVVKAVAPVVHVAPVVKTYSAPVIPVVKTVAPVVPVVHAAPVVPVVKTVAPVVPVVKTYSAPVVHHVPVVKSVVAPVVPVVHAAPVVKSVFSAPVAHFVHH